ncbi:MAG: hypothetical protein KIT11_11885 [Fimbriimonadaceae bacterium]|nr:hypothetical protein [Fimbriimonadaceae bacterium]QYK55265.1 MAG: hypothetical protein KF733_09650 [Fimbriimonadaceae bacterium]
METFWEQDLTREETDRLIEKVADEVAKRGMEVPAVFFLEMHKPVMGIAAQGTIAFSPFLVPFLGFDAINDYSRLMRNRAALERLISRIEEKKLAGQEA